MSILRHMFITPIAAALCIVGSASAAIVDVNCTNNTTDTTTLNNAISSSATGDQIRIHGTCLINGTIVLKGDRTYEGDSRTGTVIQQASGSNLTAMLASDSWNNDSSTTGTPIRISHLTLDGNKAGNSNTSALVIRSWLTVIEDLQVKNAPADGIQITNLSKNSVALSKSQVNGRISNCYVTDSGAIGIHIVDTGNTVTDWDLMDSWVASSGTSGIYMDNSAGWKVKGVHLYANQQHALYAKRCYATAIEGNYIEDFGKSGGAGNVWYGIACTIQGDAASVIANNKVFMFGTEPASGTFRFIAIPQVNYGTAIANVVDNVIKGKGTANDTGLFYRLSGGTDLQVVSSNNNVQSVSTTRDVGTGVTLVTGL